jgi:uncharacterized protein (TIGR02246 family)
MTRLYSKVLSIAAILAVAMAAACAEQTAKQPAPPPDTRKADEATIRAASAEWSKAAAAKDLDKAVSYYAEDAVYLTDKGAMVNGKNSIRMVWKDVVAPGAATLTWAANYVEVARSGDIAYEYGTYKETSEVKKGKPKEAKGKYVAVWKKQKDGGWKVALDIDNTGE